MAYLHSSLGFPLSPACKEENWNADEEGKGHCGPNYDPRQLAICQCLAIPAVLTTELPLL